MVWFTLTMLAMSPFTVHSVTVMLQVMRRMTSATPAPANAASSAIYRLEQH